MVGAGVLAIVVVVERKEGGQVGEALMLQPGTREVSEAAEAADKWARAREGGAPCRAARPAEAFPASR